MAQERTGAQGAEGNNEDDQNMEKFAWKSDVGQSRCGPRVLGNEASDAASSDPHFDVNRGAHPSFIPLGIKKQQWHLIAHFRCCFGFFLLPLFIFSQAFFE